MAEKVGNIMKATISFERKKWESRDEMVKSFQLLAEEICDDNALKTIVVIEACNMLWRIDSATRRTTKEYRAAQ